MPPDQQAALLASIEQQLDYTRAEGYRPYEKQQRFHDAGANHRERALFAGNQLGKTLAASFEVAFHLTGRYPDWWRGLRFARPNNWLAGSESGELTRRGVQRLLFGRDIKTAMGSGAIPKECIVDWTMQRGVADLLDTVLVRFEGSKKLSSVSLKAYEQGREKWQADTVDGVWFDEEPPMDIYTEGLTRTNHILGPIILTLTPLKGMSEVVERFMNGKFPGTWHLTMTIDDVAHYTPEQKALIVASYPEYEVEARTKGVPSVGSGRIYPFAESAIKIDPIPIPEHWARIAGLDIGWDHPTAVVWIAWDRDTDTLYIYDCLRETKKTPALIAVNIKERGDWIPVAWPADGLQTEKGTGRQIISYYKAAKVAVLGEHAQYPETADATASSRVSVEAGILDLYRYMEAGRLKVFSTCVDWFEEFRLYHRDEEGKIVKLKDDLMDATRYAKMMLRRAITRPARTAGIATFEAFDSGAGY